MIAEASSSCGNALVRGRRRIATTAVRFTRLPHSLSFAHICSSPFAALHLDECPGLMWDTIRSLALQKWLFLTLCPWLHHLFVHLVSFAIAFVLFELIVSF